MFSDLKKKDPGSVPSGVLAYIGDSVFELYTRLSVIRESEEKMKGIHQRTIAIVNAGAQAAAARQVIPLLTEEETLIFKRGRNANTGTMAKNANAADYRVATGMEALIGYLFLAGRDERLLEILRMLIPGESAER